MEECPNLSKCGFFKEYENDERMHEALRGFVNLYCKGPRQEDCIRKKVSKALGGPDHVPLNMKPNGKRIIESSNEEWSDEVKKNIS